MKNLERLSDADLTTKRLETTADWVNAINNLPEELITEIVKAKNADQDEGTDLS